MSLSPVASGRMTGMVRKPTRYPPGVTIEPHSREGGKLSGDRSRTVRFGPDWGSIGVGLGRNYGPPIYLAQAVGDCHEATQPPVGHRGGRGISALAAGSGRRLRPVAEHLRIERAPRRPRSGIHYVERGRR